MNQCTHTLSLSLSLFFSNKCCKFRYALGRLLSIAEETLAEFLSKATGTAVDWVQMPGMKVCHCLIQMLFSFIYWLIDFVYASSDIIFFASQIVSLSAHLFKSVVSLVRIRLGYLPFPKVVVEWQLEPVVL